MIIEIPRETERLGAVLIHSVQKVFELDSGLSQKGDLASSQAVIRRFPYDALYAIEQQMAIIVPVRSERIKLVEGVLCGIPNQCLTIIVSNSPRKPVDRFAMEREAFQNFSRFTGKQVFVVHQRNPIVAEAIRCSGYSALLDEETGLLKGGKAEAMILATLLARLSGRSYVGFIDADNYFPGAVLEYVHEYAAVFAMSGSPYTMARIAWHSKPKVIEDSLFFAKWGRTSRNTNRHLNTLIGEYSGFETEIVKTGNAGEHALTTELAMLLDYSSGFSIEPYHFINMFERFGGLLETPLDSDLLRKNVEVFQVESRNPHMHDTDKGDNHIQEMTLAAMQVIYHSPICPKRLKKQLLEEMQAMNLLPKKQKPRPVTYYPTLANVDLDAFAQAISKHPYSSLLLEGAET